MRFLSESRKTVCDKLFFFSVKSSETEKQQEIESCDIFCEWYNDFDSRRFGYGKESKNLINKRMRTRRRRGSLIIASTGIFGI